MLRRELEINGNEEVRGFSKVYVKEVRAIRVYMLLNMSEAPAEPPQIQMFPLRFLYHLYKHLGEETLFILVKSNPANSWNGKWGMGLNMYEISPLPAVNYGAAGVFLKNWGYSIENFAKVCLVGIW